ncbi:MAG: hypothetical protein K2X25_03305 [Caulobacteraceae bacterium]|nr:hypothetical protein [Caulobacteraceae bacterium]
MQGWTRRVAAVALLACTAMAGPAVAQQTDFSGTFSFQSGDLDPGPRFNLISGYADSEAVGDGTYLIVLVATEYQQTEQSSRRVYAVQDCVGRPSGRDIAITCEVSMTTSTTNYRPDNFLLRPSGDQGLWQGQVTSNGSAEVEFVLVN